TCLLVFRIDQQIFVVIDMLEEILFREVVECGCEQELAERAAVVIDGHARDLQDLAVANLAILVEVHHTVGKSRRTTALARRLLRADGLQSRFHERSPPCSPRSRGGRPVASRSTRACRPGTGTRSAVTIGRVSKTSRGSLQAQL